MSSKNYFEQVAQDWDTIRQGYFGESLREKSLLRAENLAGSLAADIGAGTGFISEGLVERGASVIAVDQSHAMLEIIRNKFGNLVDCRPGDAEKLPIADLTVDYVFANMFLHHVESPATAIKEMYRILKKGGKLIITDMFEHNFTFLRDEQQDVWLGFNSEELSSWLQDAGMQDVRVDCADETCCAKSECGCAEGRVSVFIASGTKL